MRNEPTAQNQPWESRGRISGPAGLRPKKKKKKKKKKQTTHTNPTTGRGRKTGEPKPVERVGAASAPTKWCDRFSSMGFAVYQIGFVRPRRWCREWGRIARLENELFYRRSKKELGVCIEKSPKSGQPRNPESRGGHLNF